MILLDANILLEMLITGRTKRDLVFLWMEQSKDNFCISMLTVHLVLHFGLKDGLSITDIKNFLSDYPKISLLSDDYVSAMDLIIGQDHEDALQLSCALRMGCSSIVTLDKKFSRTYADKLQFITL